MYRIIGADGNQYGPISAEQLRQWIAEGRANAQTKVLAEGTTEWKPLSEFPEFFPSASTPGPAPLPPSPAPGIPAMQPLGASYGYPGAADQVTGPAIGLMVVSILQLLLGAFLLVVHLIGASIFAMSQSAQNQPFANLFSGTLGIVQTILVMVLGAVVLFGAIKMKRLENYGLAMASSIVAMLPCSLCCLAGLPIGIWSLVILSKPEVKAAFH
jgi:GYF domain 2